MADDLNKFLYDGIMLSGMTMAGDDSGVTEE